MWRVAAFNVNGIRAARRRGFGAWLARTDADVVTLQEVRCPVESLPEETSANYHLCYDPGSRAGRNGVAVLTREAPAAVRTWGSPVLHRSGVGGSEPAGSRTTIGGPLAADSRETWLPFDGEVKLARGMNGWADEGRYLEVDLADRPVTVASLYLPKGGLPAKLQRPGRMRERPDGGAAHDRKVAFMAAFGRQLVHSRRRAREAGRQFLLTGDLNIAHQNEDLTNWKTNGSSPGFLPHERAWIDEVIGSRTLVDVLRVLNPDTNGPYSWWSWMGESFAKDVGWRIDYQLASPALAATATAAWVDRPASADERISDHAPVVVDYDG